MFSLIGAVLGFLTSALPEVLKLWQEKQDRQHELAIMEKQMEQQRLGYAHKLEEISIDADIRETEALLRHDSQPSGVRWVDGLRASVRPIITYAFFIAFLSVKGCGLYVVLVHDGVSIFNALPQLWDAETQALFSAVISYWFGARSLAKLRGSTSR